MAGGKKARNSSGKKKKTRQKKEQGWLRRHLAGIIYFLFLLCLLAGSLVAVGYVIFLYR